MLAVPLALALPPFSVVVTSMVRASRTPLGRDQGIFQYVAWALLHGAVDYRDVRDVNGPLTHLVHVVFLLLGGADEHRFRCLDLLGTSIAFAFTGACLPGLYDRRRPPWSERAAWAVAAWVVLSGQYLLYKYWDLAQRESFCDALLLPSLGLGLLAQSAPARSAEGRGRGMLLAGLSGALGVVTWFGKPTYVIFTGLELAVFAVGEGSWRARTRTLLAFAAGGSAGAAAILGLLLAFGDPRAFFRIELVDVPTMYRFVWPRAPAEIVSLPWADDDLLLALVGAVVLSALVLLGEMPRRGLTFALAPVAALLSVVVQRKGFPYHFHPVTAGLALEGLVVVVLLGERTREARRDRRVWRLVRLVPLAAAGLLALRVTSTTLHSPYAQDAWLSSAALTAEQRATPAYFAHFPEVDFFPYELRQAAAYLRARTGTADRVQVYGMDAYVLFLAKRASATPYIYAYDLNADAALYGGAGGKPDAAQAEAIRALRDRNEADMVERLLASPPSAWVFEDGAPLLDGPDAEDDFERHCPTAATWMRQEYQQTAQFGHVRVWLRHDLAASELGPPTDPALPGAR